MASGLPALASAGVIAGFAGFSLFSAGSILADLINDVRRLCGGFGTVEDDGFGIAHKFSEACHGGLDLIARKNEGFGGWVEGIKGLVNDLLNGDENWQRRHERGEEALENSDDELDDNDAVHDRSDERPDSDYTPVEVDSGVSGKRKRPTALSRKCQAALIRTATLPLMVRE